MKKRTLCLSLFLGVAAIASAQDEAAYKTWMKSLPGTMTEMNKNAKAGDWKAVAPDAKKAEEVFTQSAAFWTKRGGGDDAAGWSKDAAAAAAKLSAAASSGDAAGAEAGLKAVSGSCRGCHTAHREKAEDGSYKFK